MHKESGLLFELEWRRVSRTAEGVRLGVRYVLEGSFRRDGDRVHRMRERVESQSWGVPVGPSRG